MAAEWFGLAKLAINLGDMVFGGISKYQKLQTDDRKRLADLLDEIAKDLLQMPKALDKNEIPEAGYAQVNAYREQLPPLIQRVYDPDVANQIQQVLGEVYGLRQIVLVMNRDGPPDLKKEEFSAIASTIKAAAGTITATANILRAI